MMIAGDVVTVPFLFHHVQTDPDTSNEGEKSSSPASPPPSSGLLIDVCSAYESKVNDLMRVAGNEGEEIQTLVQDGRVKTRRIQDAYLDATRSNAVKQKKHEEEFQAHLLKIQEKKSHLEVQIQNIRREMAARIEQLDSQIAEKCVKA